MSDGQAIGALVSFIIAAASGIGWLIRRRDNAKDPIPKQSAAVALAGQSVTMMASVAAEIRGDLQGVRSELAEVKAESRLNARRVISLEESVETLDESLSAAVRFIEQLIRYMRAGAHGPEPAIPNELAGLIDPMLRHWGSAGVADT